MTKFISIFLLIGLCGVNMMSQHKEPDTTFRYSLRNLRNEKRKNSLRENNLTEKKNDPNRETSNTQHTL